MLRNRSSVAAAARCNLRWSSVRGLSGALSWRVDDLAKCLSVLSGFRRNLLALVCGFGWLLALTTSSPAQQGVLGWQWNGYHATAHEACYAAWDQYMNNGYSRFIGALPYAQNPTTRECSWTSWQYLCPAETGGGISTCFTILPPTVGFFCASGYTFVADGQCLPDDQLVRQPEPCTSNFGGNHSPTVGNPILLASGVKIERLTDFQTADGRLSIQRHYRSTPEKKNSFAVWAPVRGEVGGWRFDFSLEVHLAPTNDAVSVHTPQGVMYNFAWDGVGFPRTTTWIEKGYKLEFVGTPPNNWNNAHQASTQWKVTDPEDRVWTLQTFNRDNKSSQYRIARPIQMIERDGYTLTYSYGTLGELESITDSFGRTLEFTWRYYNITALTGISGSLPIPEAVTQILLPDGNKLRYTYDPAASNPSTAPAARLTKVELLDTSDQVIDSTTYHYEDTNFPRHLTGTTDERNVRTLTVEYDALGRAVKTKGANGADEYTVAYSKTGSNYVATVTNPLGKVAKYNFIHTGGSGSDVRLTSIEGQASTNCPASTGTYAYTNRVITSVTDEEGRVTAYTRDSSGRPTVITRGSGTGDAATTNITYHSTLNVPTEVEEPGLTTEFTWTNGKLTSVTQTDTTSHSSPYTTNGQTRTWTYGYTGVLLTTIDGPLTGSGDTITYSYDADGYLQTVTNEVGHLTTINAVNGRGLPTQITDPNSVLSVLTYDDRGRLTSVTQDSGGIGAVTGIDYDDAGQIVKITRPNGGYHEFTWSNARRLTKVEDNTGAVMEYDHDAMGNIVEWRIKDGSDDLVLTEASTFDELGRLLTHVGAGNQTWSFAHDKTSNLVAVTDPRSNTYQYAFDALNRLIKEINEGSSEINLARNGKDEIVEYSDFRSLETTYVRNGFGEVIQRTSPDTGATVYEYSAAGKLTKITDARSVVTNLAYDNAGRLQSKEYPGAPAEDITYTWDSVASGNHGKGRITKIEDQSGSVEWFYDALGRVTEEKKTTGIAVYTVKYGYDADGNISEIVYPSGRIVNFSRNAIGEIWGVTTKKDSISPSVTLASDAYFMPHGGPLQSFWFGNDVVLWKTFAENYRLDLMMVQDTTSSTDIMLRWHSYDDDLNLTEIADALDGGRTQTYWYWAPNWLAEATGPWGELSYSYTANGDRTWEVLTQGVTVTERALWYPWGSNLMTDETEDSLLSREFTYDAAGNMIEDDRDGTVYEYRHNHRGRLDRITVDSQVRADYTYDALERLAVRATQNMSPSGTTHYVYDLKGRLLVEASSTGDTIREYVWLDDLPLAIVADVDTITPKLYFVHADHLNRPVMMTNEAASVVWDAIYLPFGAVHSITGSASNNLRFPGQYFQLEAGLHYNWHRHYDPTTGRYLQPDPLEFVDGPSIYAYARTNPTQLVDSRGLWIDIVADIGFIAYDIYRLFSDGRCNMGENLAALSLDVAAMLVPGVTGAGQAFRRFTPDQQALIELAKGAKQRGGVNQNEAEILRKWAKEYNMPSRGPESHPGRPFGRQPHMHIGPVNHIPVQP